jgi:predicted RecB family nuclease
VRPCDTLDAVHIRDGRRTCSPTDLANFLACRHKSVLDLAAAKGDVRVPEWVDPLADTLRERGEAHERRYVEALRASGRAVTDLTGSKERGRPEALAATRDAMRHGADIIVQAAIGDETWFGYADVLARVEVPSALGAWSYEVHDTKLARETRGGAILQLCAYTELLGQAQGVTPDVFRVITPAGQEVFRTTDFSAYYRTVKARLLGLLDHAAACAAALEAVPSPTAHCEICRWWPRCNAERRRVDHLSFVANLGRTQERELDRGGFTTLAALAHMPVPVTFKPRRGARATYESLREQARLQLVQRESRRPTFDVLPPDLGFGLGALPEPRPGDLFLDLESARFARDGGREYLFGLGSLSASGGWEYRAWWAFDDAAEAGAFEAVMDTVRAALDRDPGVHVYHFAPYEPSALKRLMGRHGTRVVELDELLRGERFVDLLAVVRRAIRAGVESYSLKQLEPFYGFRRDVELGHAADRRRIIEHVLESGDPGAIPSDVREAVEGYNQDDCRSTLELRNWLEGVRERAIAAGAALDRPARPVSEASDSVKDRQAQVDALRAKLLGRRDLAPPDEAEALRVLAYLIDWHQREDKVSWWEYFRLRDLPDEDLLEEGMAVTGLQLVDRLGPAISAKTGKATKSVVDRYRFPMQEFEIRAGAELHLRTGGKFGEVEATDRTMRTIDVKKGPSQSETHPVSAFVSDHVPSEVLSAAICRIGDEVGDGGFAGTRRGRAATDLLLRRPPRAAGRDLATTPRRSGESVADFATRIVEDLDESVLPIQGPPGSGKTHVGARMITALVRQGRRVGVTATSHKVIQNLLEAVAAAAAADGVPAALGHKVGAVDPAARHVMAFTDNVAPLTALQAGNIQVLGGTAYLWARAEYANAVDVLFVDEAGQMSLANVVAVSHAAPRLVLLGDPRQLEQPQKGTHPDGVGVSALDHILGGQATMPTERGLFLPITWRLAPPLCRATSELFYEGKLSSAVGVDQVRLVSTGRFEGAGVWVIDVPHEGNRNASEEEVDEVVRLIDELRGPAAEWIDSTGHAHPVVDADILVVAPYNAQVNRVDDRLRSAGRTIRVGTVDRFQGQQAPIVIYTMTTSGPEEAPRGLEFLFSANRLNVAISRAQAAAIIVASPKLFEPDCQTPRQMRLANALCRLRELARALAPPGEAGPNLLDVGSA